jgi:hypothetical protein
VPSTSTTKARILGMSVAEDCVAFFLSVMIFTAHYKLTGQG